MQRSPNDLSRSDRRFLWSWTAGIVVVHAVLLLVLASILILRPVASEWIAQAVQAEFVGSPPPVIVPSQIAQPGGQMRTVWADQSGRVDRSGNGGGLPRSRPWPAEL
jgi:hypothetical protein